MKRALGTLALSLILVGVVAPSAGARGDGWEFAAADPVTLPASVCGVEVNVTFPVNREYVKTVSETDTELVSRETGSLRIRVENADTLEALTVNASGPGTFTVDLTTGVVTVEGEGRWLLFFDAPDQAQFGIPGLMLVSGHFVQSQDTNTGDILSLSYHGRTRDICARIT
jgi:hypothetical protein